MEPRPPQPRSSRPFELPGSPETAGIGERLYPAPGEAVYVPGNEAYPTGTAEPPLLARRQRRQRGALRGIAVAVVAIGALLAVGWFFRDAVRGFVDPPAAMPTVAVVAVDPGTPTPQPETAALPNALATVTPTAVSEIATTPPAPDDEASVAQEPATNNEADSAVGDDEISAETLPLLELLPTQAQVPAELTMTREAERSKAEVVESLGGSEQASQQLDEWGWSGNAFRDFVADASAPSPSGTTFLNVSVHRFADAESAANALVVYSDEVVVAQGLQEIEEPAIGESARLLVGELNDVYVAVLYVQDDSILYRLGGSAPLGAGDPTNDVLAVAGEIVPGRASGG